jgi:CheY-like chemotaxis protein
MATVLIVNDDPDFLEALSQVLEVENHEVVSATSCGEALRLAVTSHPQAIVSDFKMRGDDGVAFFEELRDRRLCSDVPKFLLSGSNEVVVRNRLQAAGLDVPLVSKSENIDVLLQALRESLRARGDAGTGGKDRRPPG